jgi:RND family efflux transporter MFP subunit|tara:strand:- start:2427 stop:3614 length:1188 start_codon:yes stop_codon:yes gene_type:complete
MLLLFKGILMPSRANFIYSPFFIVSCFIAVLVIALGFSRYSQSNDSAYSEQNLPLLVETIGMQTFHGLTNGEHYVGRIEAGQRAEVGFDISGVVTSVLKSEGDTFRKGDILATLDTERLEAKQRELEAGITRANAAKKLAKSSLKRAESLKASRNISDQALDEALQKRDSADAEYELVVAQQATIDVELKKAKLTAPFDGVVIDRMTDEGRATNPGASVLLLEEIGKTEIRVGLPLKEARELAVGDTLKIEHNGDIFESVIDRINLALSTSRVSEIYLLPQNYHGKTLISGELVRAVLPKQLVLDEGIWLPLSSLTEYGRGLWSVYFAKPHDSAANYAIIERTIVEVIQIQGEYAQVKGGVNNDMVPYVVSSSTHRVVAGQKVRLASVSTDAKEQ